MKIKIFILTAIYFNSCQSFDIPSKKDKWYVYYLGGQSNMDGYGYNSELPDSLRVDSENVMIFDGNRINDEKEGGGVGKWSNLKPGHGVGFKTDGHSNFLSERFGPELSFARTLNKKKTKIAIIKYSFGGTGLFQGAGYGNWDPDFDGINHYDNALSIIKNAHATFDINRDGIIDELIPSGIIWMQGEADAQHSKESADAYFFNLGRLMNLFRAALRQDDLPVIIGKINDSFMTKNNAPTQPYISIVHAAQKEFVDKDPCAFYVTETETYNFSSDAWHYDSDGYIKMGIAFARAFNSLSDICEEYPLLKK